MSHPLKFELTLAPVSHIVVYSDTIKAPNYKITNLELEYDGMTSEYLSQEAKSSHQIGKKVLLLKHHSPQDLYYQ